MRRSIAAFVVVTVSLFCEAAAGGALTVADLKTMIAAKLPDAVIIDALKVEPERPAIDESALLDLRAAGASRLLLEFLADGSANEASLKAILNGQQIPARKGANGRWPVAVPLAASRKEASDRTGRATPRAAEDRKAISRSAVSPPSSPIVSQLGRMLDSKKQAFSEIDLAVRSLEAQDRRQLARASAEVAGLVDSFLRNSEGAVLRLAPRVAALAPAIAVQVMRAVAKRPKSEWGNGILRRILLETICRLGQIGAADATALRVATGEIPDGIPGEKRAETRHELSGALQFVGTTEGASRLSLLQRYFAADNSALIACAAFADKKSLESVLGALSSFEGDSARTASAAASALDLALAPNCDAVSPLRKAALASAAADPRRWTHITSTLTSLASNPVCPEATRDVLRQLLREGPPHIIGGLVIALGVQEAQATWAVSDLKRLSRDPTHADVSLAALLKILGERRFHSERKLRKASAALKSKERRTAEEEEAAGGINCARAEALFARIPRIAGGGFSWYQNDCSPEVYVSHLARGGDIPVLGVHMVGPRSAPLARAYRTARAVRRDAHGRSYGKAVTENRYGIESWFSRDRYGRSQVGFRTQNAIVVVTGVRIGAAPVRKIASYLSRALKVGGAKASTLKKRTETQEELFLRCEGGFGTSAGGPGCENYHPIR